jgi:hypothetical protein
MKNIFWGLLLTLSFTTTTYADLYDGNLEETALQLLMKKNPIATSPDGLEDTEVNNIIALGVLSYYNSNGIILSIVTNECNQEPISATNLAVYKCNLILANSDRNVNSDGSFSGPLLESVVSISYTYTVDELNASETVSDVTFSFAG